MGGKTGGTLLKCNVEVDDAIGECVELSGLHIHGTVDLAPRDVTRVRLSRVRDRTALTCHAALFLTRSAEDPRPRGGEFGQPRGNGGLGARRLCDVHINAVGVVLRATRYRTPSRLACTRMRALRRGVHMSMCARSGRAALSRARTANRYAGTATSMRIGCSAMRTRYSGYSGDCRAASAGARAVRCSLMGWATARLVGRRVAEDIGARSATRSCPSPGSVTV